MERIKFQIDMAYEILREKSSAGVCDRLSRAFKSIMAIFK